MPAPFASTRERFIVQSLQAIAAASNINCTLHADGWIIELSKAGRRHLVYGYTFDLNSASASAVANDKAGMSALLYAHQLPHVTHNLVLAPAVFTGTPDSCENLLHTHLHNTAELVGYPLVCKANQGSGGQLVFCVHNRSQLEAAAADIFKTQRALALSPFIDIAHEYRIIMLQGEVLLAYEKIRPRPTPQNPFWRHNLGQGARPVLLSPARINELVPIATAAMQAGNLSVAAVDIINKAGTDMVLEVNTGIMLEHFARLHDSGRALGHAVYEQVVSAVFAAD